MNSQRWYKRYPSDELAMTIGLTCEECGFLQHLRDYSLDNNGIPDDEVEFRRIASAWLVSRYKLKKLWKKIEKFFTLRDGFFFFEDDEHQRAVVIDISSKRRSAGHLGASARWSESAHSAAVVAGASMAIAITPAPEPYTEEPAAAIPTRVEGAAAAASSCANKTNAVADLETLVIRSHELGMAAPTSAFAAKMRAKFFNVDFRTLPLFPGQKSVGLWLQKSEQEIRAEIERQHPPPDKKPPAKAGPPPPPWQMEGLPAEEYHAREICHSKNRKYEPGHERYTYRKATPYLDQTEWVYPHEIIDTQEDTVIEVVTHKTILNRGKKS